MGKMNRMICVMACTAAALCGADLASVRAVYVMPMARGMDQYLANRLAAERVLTVVSDPKLADAVLTDHLGEDLSSSLDDLNPAKPVSTGESKDSGESKAGGETVNKLDSVSSTFGRAKGLVFLVDAKTREVVWSTFEAPGRLDSAHLDRTASDIVSRLKRDLKQGSEQTKAPKK